MVKISIIIPLYNAEKYIERCLNSLIKQNDSSFEVIIVNDGSKDNGAAVVERVIKDIPNFHLFHQENHGVAYARNTGLTKCTGEYVTFIDADDYVSTDYIEKLTSFIEQNKNADVIQFETVRNEYRACVWSKLLKKELIDKYNIEFFAGCAIGTDFPFCEIARIHANKIAYCQSHVYYYAQTENSISLNYQNRLKIYMTLDRLKAYLDENKCEYDKDKIRSVFFRHGAIYPLLFLKEHHIKGAKDYKEQVYAKIKTYDDILTPREQNKCYINRCVQSLYCKNKISQGIHSLRKSGK